MIRLVNGNLFNRAADALTNPCNTIGVSGAGLAKTFAQRFPAEQREYERIAKADKLHLGEILVVPCAGYQPKWIVYFPTKGHWREQSRLESVEGGLHYLRAWLQTTPSVRSISIPALGCGLGGLPYPTVRESMRRILRPVTRVDIALYEPQETR